MERDPNKRKVKPPSNPELVNLDDIAGESSSDSDFRIEDHVIGSDSDIGSYFTDGEDDDDDDDDDNDEEEEDENENENVDNNISAADASTEVTTIQFNSKKVNLKEIVDKIHICSICLGDASDAVNELIDCDECGISVHEGCYGVHDTGSVSSSVSSCSMEPWFCEACKAGVENPTCELCPNFGGIFKETDCGKWVHLVCALYVQGITFGEVTSLNRVILFPNTSPRWGAKSCILCKDMRFMCTGVTIACDAGLCRSNFHVTCAQREGFLSEATSPDTDQSDPFYAHCKLHVDKLIAKKRKRNWEALQLRTRQMKILREEQAIEKSGTWQRNQRRLEKLRSKYYQSKNVNNPELTLKSRVPRSITTSASACRALWLKASLMGVNLSSYEAIEGHIKALRDVPKKWHIPPTFSLEFVSYFLDRNLRLTELKKQLKYFTEQNIKLHNEQSVVQEKYNQVSELNEKQKQKHLELKNCISAYHNVILFGDPNAKLPNMDVLVVNDQNTGQPHTVITSDSVSKPAALKAGVGFSLKHTDSTGIIDNDVPLGLNNKCGICAHGNDQHLLAKCDKCRLYYHLGCLNPPLTRMPKKTKLFGWQCSECDNSRSNSEPESVDPNAPRKLRNVSREHSVSDSFRSPSLVNDEIGSLDDLSKPSSTQKKKKHHERHRERYSPEMITKRVKTRKRKHKHHRENNIVQEIEPFNDPISEPPRQGIKLFIKSVPSASGVKTTSSQLLIAPPVDDVLHVTKPKPEKSVEPLRITTTSNDVKVTPKCNNCKTTGTSATMVQCDECSKNFHFRCLDPPVKKSPKVRGYSWHCAECDPTDSDSS
ncbi:PHD finger protein 14 isoform X2 [Adelges cooleyi]|uniref:PHD finger protein 14 isoform X2 n=1 Tax=Adelges cooleyi TaxID=133065 RepID=UPI0021809921|nr:PHD finger protein 14 isoform X2 [Adelges cooleyi]